MPHHLIDILHPAEGIYPLNAVNHCFSLQTNHLYLFQPDYSAGNFYDDGRQATKDILNRGHVPIVTGGTGLYLRWYILIHINLFHIC